MVQLTNGYKQKHETVTKRRVEKIHGLQQINENTIVDTF
jgi:hypothetical protein